MKIKQADLMAAMQQAMYVRSDDIPSGYEKVGSVFCEGICISIYKSRFFTDDFVKTSPWYDSLWSEKKKKRGNSNG